MSTCKNQSGFTLMELMVVMVIIGLLSSMAVVNYASIGKKSAVAMAAQNLVSDLRQSQSFALNGKIFESSGKGAWGFYSSEAVNDGYVIFSDNNLNNLKDIGEDYQIIQLPKNVKIKNIDPGVESTVVYIPPDPKIIINASAVSSSTIILSDSEGNNEKKIDINIFGLVDIE